MIYGNVCLMKSVSISDDSLLALKKVGFFNHEPHIWVIKALNCASLASKECNRCVHGNVLSMEWRTWGLEGRLMN